MCEVHLMNQISESQNNKHNHDMIIHIDPRQDDMEHMQLVVKLWQTAELGEYKKKDTSSSYHDKPIDCAMMCFIGE
jgi:hypothetical protein